MSKKMDLRVKRTRKLINEAFLKLIQQKGFDSVTIQDIAEEALINRGTFYLHYEDKYDLLEKISRSAIDELTSVLNPVLHVKEHEVQIEKLRTTIEKVYESMEKNQVFYTVMFGEHGVYNFRNNLEEVIRENFSKKMIELGVRPEDFEIPKDLILHFISAAFVGVVQWWLKQSTKPSSQEMAMKLSKIITAGPMQAAGLKIEKQL
ncbi:TetR/AcrR family transcriptional regulator [Pseudalkalibacillus salsuginis]|uniref:TetR/AcrR family transcriptional regulator n=1 Tax=Pseudalkalibacillus salsuginis TaxID=2910972 RepID=UPI001F45A090|nr:TetR/AcrR family transcriptional regulator [Pseudalkalibacillus salsuginis]MCF6411446.1 TetR/AcrR family transcriptional regulator [Pseudalkalibacillus salsuginis]